MFPPSILFATVLCLSASFSLISATLVNVTVDDSQTNEGALVIQYTPVDTWNDGPNCPACTAHPNPENTMNETWHDSTHQSGAGEDGLSFATLEFDGRFIPVPIIAELFTYLRLRCCGIRVLCHCPYFYIARREHRHDLCHRWRNSRVICFGSDEPDDVRLQCSRTL